MDEKMNEQTEQTIYPNLDRAGLESELEAKAADLGFALPDISSWDEQQIAEMLVKLGGPKDVSTY